MKERNNFDAIVIGAGHAGAEAAHILAVLGKKTALMTLSLEAVSFMACNPNVGGTAKGHLVREIDALGGIMAEIADKTTLQTRMLNLGHGHAVHSLRAQVDKNKYHRMMKQKLERTKNLYMFESEAIKILTEDYICPETGEKKKKVTGVETEFHDVYKAPVVVICTGVYLQARIITGDHSRPTGPSGFRASLKLTQNLLDLGLDIRRFKTGTPPRLLSSSIDFDRMEIQYGDKNNPKFSYMTEGETKNDFVCYLTYTNEKTKEIILNNLNRSPMFNGSIEGTGARYCPSIEDKIVKFKDKERHQIFIEPEGEDTEEMYAQGISTSLPYDVQEEIVHSIQGLENAKITRYGYAIEYDCLDPLELLPSLAVKKVEGLFAAGQINGTSGYEEAAAQGLIAGINAARAIDRKEPLVLRRDQAYIGVLIDDLVTKGTNEPYRIMTSRAEHRLELRQDNADFRLTETGYMAGTVSPERYAKYKAREEETARLKGMLDRVYKKEEVADLFAKRGETIPKQSVRLRDILKRGKIKAEDLYEISEEYKDFALSTLEHVEIELKYEGYLEKERRDIKEALRLEATDLSFIKDYSQVDGLRIEAKQKLTKIKPQTLAQASRISGVNPADITVLLMYVRKNKRQ